MAEIDLPSIGHRLASAQSVLLTTHANPDGDAVGSVLGLAHLLRAAGKKVCCVNDDPVPRLYAWLPAADMMTLTKDLPAEAEMDVAVILDAARVERTGQVAKILPRANALLVLDHHLESSPEGEMAYLDPGSSAVGEIVLDLADAMGLPLSREAAVCLYVSIVTDTGGFRFQNTTPRTHRLVARLLEAGVDAADVARRVFDVLSVGKLELLRRVLDRMERTCGGRLAHSYVTMKDFVEASATVEDLDGVVNYTRNIEGGEVGMLFRETADGATKVSARSGNSFNCAVFFAPYGGGGHALAAGATLKMPLMQARDEVVRRAAQELGGER